MRTTLALFVAAALLSPSVSLAAGGGGGGSGSGASFPAATQRTPEEVAQAKYRSGLKRRDKAWKYETRAAEAATEKKRAKFEKKAQKQFKKAAGLFEQAIARNPLHYPAWSSLGYALRRMGNYDRSLEAYDESLRLNPSYTEAIEYRAEAHLALEEQSDATLYWRKYQNPQPHCSGKIMVCGHTVQQSGRPLNDGHSVCIDTWAHGGGWLSCLDVASGTLWQANEAGETRQLDL